MEKYKIQEVKKLPDNEAEILGEITLDYLNSVKKDAVKHLNEHLNLPGFRKGMIPEDILIKTVGEMSVLEETAEIAMSRVYGEIVLESKLRPITRPNISITKLAPGIPLEFKINLVLEPEFELPDYKKIASETKDEDAEKRKLMILENIVKETKLELPKKFLENESSHMLHHFKQDVDKAGIKWEEYLEKVKKSEEEVKKSFAEQIESRTKAELIIGKIAEENKLNTYKEVFEFLEK